MSTSVSTVLLERGPTLLEQPHWPHAQDASPELTRSLLERRRHRNAATVLQEHTLQAPEHHRQVPAATVLLESIRP